MLHKVAGIVLCFNALLPAHITARYFSSPQITRGWRGERGLHCTQQRWTIARNWSSWVSQMVLDNYELLPAPASMQQETRRSVVYKQPPSAIQDLLPEQTLCEPTEGGCLKNRANEDLELSAKAMQKLYTSQLASHWPMMTLTSR